MKSFLGLVLGAFILISLTACGKALPAASAISLTPIDVASSDDGSVVHGRAMYTVSAEQDSTLAKLFSNLFMNKAYAANGSTSVTYTNSASTNFAISVVDLGATGFTGTTLNLGKVALSTLSDNNLKVCGTGGTTKCTQAAIRVYTTGSIAGFVNTSDTYGVPVYTGSLNPTTPVGLLAAGSVQTQTLSISSSKHTVAITDFPTPSYNISADFSNAGAGSYAMTYVVEYVLLP